MWTLVRLVACSGDPTYIVEGTVVSVEAPATVVLDHDAIRGLMEPMVMPFTVEDPAWLKMLEPGHRVIGRLRREGADLTLERLRVVGREAPPTAPAPPPIQPGEHVGNHAVVTAGGERLRLDRGPLLLTFFYTRCPIPEMCPLTMTRLQSVLKALPADSTARLVAVTLDPEHDTPEVLEAQQAVVGGQIGRFDLARAEDLPALAGAAGLSVMREGQEIAHGARWWVVSPTGQLIERYDDQKWPTERVVSQLQIGEPVAPSGSSTTTAP